MLGATLVWHASNFAFNSLAGRLLGPSSYGIVGAMTALLYLSSPLFVSIQTVASRLSTALNAAGRQAQIRVLVRYYGVRLACASVILASLVALTSTAIARFLRIESAAPIAILAVALAFSSLSHLQRGVLQGTLRLGGFALSQLAEAAVKLAATGVLLLWIWRSADAAVLAIVLGVVSAIAANWLLLRPLPAAGGAQPVNHPYRYSLATLASLILLATLLSVDVLAAKRYLDPHSAGIYAAVSLCGKAGFFVTSAVSFALFPHFSARHDQGQDARSVLVSAIGVIVVGATLLVGLYAALPELIVRPLFGTRFDAAMPYLSWAGIAFSAYGIVYLTAMYLLSQKRAAGIYLMAGGVTLQLAGLYALHSSIPDILGVNIAVFGVLGMALILTAMRHAHRTTPVVARHDPT